MIVSNKKVSEEYRKVYPDLEDYYCIILSEKLWVPSLEDVINWLKKYSVMDLPDVKSISDCDVRAEILKGRILEERATASVVNLPEEEKFKASIGWMSGIRITPFGKTEHTAMTAYTTEGIRYIETKTNLIQEVDITKFNALLLVM
jgi:hypothetical protein